MLSMESLFAMQRATLRHLCGLIGSAVQGQVTGYMTRVLDALWVTGLVRSSVSAV